MKAAKAETDKPSLICCKTVIGLGAPNKQGTHDVHGAPLGDAEIAAARAHIGWPHAPFEIPADVYAAWDAQPRAPNARPTGTTSSPPTPRPSRPNWPPSSSAAWPANCPPTGPSTSKKALSRVNAKAETVATRKASQNAINALAPALPEFLGGSADLTGSNLTNWSGCKGVSGKAPATTFPTACASSAWRRIMNGMALHGGLMPYGGTFLMFSEYARNALRMAALMKQRVIYVFTHDSIGLGEDGPTHQPVEQTATCA
jgi:transketolase